MATAPIQTGQGSALHSLDAWAVEGWMQGTVSAIVQTRDGYLWLGSYNGLVRYDGARFQVYDSANTPGLNNGRITSLYETADGTLLVGHETGHLTRKTGARFEPVAQGPSWEGGAIEAISQDEHQDIWLLNNAGVLFRVRDGHSAECPGGASASRKAVLSRQNNGKLWVVANGRAAALKDGVLRPVTFPGDNESEYYQQVVGARDGGLWVMKEGRIRKLKNNRWTVDMGDCPCGPGAGSLLRETASGILLVGTISDGLYAIAPGVQPLHLSRTNGLAHNWVRALCEDHEGNIWVGTGAGLETVRSRKVRMLSAPDGFRGCTTMSLALTQDGTFWVGTEGAGIYRFRQGEWTAYGEESGLGNSFVWSVLAVPDGELLVGTWGAGLHAWNGAGFAPAAAFASISAPVVSMHASKEALWVGTTQGLYEYKNGRLKRVAGPERLTLPDVRTIAETSDGTLWFGMSGGGLGALKDGELKQYGKADGLGSDFVQALSADEDGTLWIGTADAGLCRWKQGQFTSLTPAQGLPATVLCHILDDGAGYLWVSSHRGIFRAGKRHINQCAEGALRVVPWQSYGKAEGLTTPICSGGFQPGALKTSDGLLWFPTARGLACIDPGNVSVNQVPPPVVIEDLIIDDRPMPIHTADLGATVNSQGLRIPPGKRRFELRFAGLSFAAPEKVRFKYKLEGLETDWRDSEGLRSVQYNYLQPGHYTFRVLGCNNDNVWNERGASLAFTVLPPFWQTWWFKGMTILGSAGSIGATVLAIARRRLRRKLELLERQRALERERARIARDIHDDLGASLTRITLLCQSVRGELDNHQQAAGDLDQIYCTARELTRAMDEIVWAVNPKHDTLDSLVTYLGRFAQAFLSSAGLRCRLDVPLNLPTWALTSEVRHNLFLALKEALNNAVKHAHATEVRIQLELQPRQFVLSIIDNGCGFTPENPAVGQDSARSLPGNGLSNIRRRLEEIGGASEWQSAPGDGTRVKLAVRISQK
ncbi:MAG TPA: two-component regulator propeller domain-containing protein [Clostridia bacterium]|nr:two-component regulator propeller domain-containing protein [Clostridia bacterium]